MGLFTSWPLRRSGSFSRHGEGSSRRGRRFGSGKSGQDEPSTGKADSSTHSALFDLELSARGGGSRGPTDYVARLNPSVADDGSATYASGDPSVRLPSGLLQRIIYLGRPVMEFELDLLQDARALRPSCVRPDGHLDLGAMVAGLQEMGYACYVKQNNPADPGHRHNVQPSCLEKLRHEYVMCAGRTDGSLSHWCLVDPRFREQFAIAQPTPQYERVLKAAPMEFVGTPLRLQALVDTLCAEMAEAFTSQQRTLPPWRKLKSMLSKWFDPEEMPGLAAPGAPAAPPPGPPRVAAEAPPLAHLQQATAEGLQMLSPFELQQAQAAASVAAGAGRGVALSDLAGSGRRGSGGPPQTRLQQQAAAALAERQSSGGGSQEFFQALAMHKESMRLQQQQQQAGRTSPLCSGPQCSPAAGSSPASAQQQQQQHAVMQQQLDAAFYGPAAASDDSSRQGERSNKPRRRRQQQQHPGSMAPLWAPPESGTDYGEPVQQGGASPLGNMVGLNPSAPAALHDSGSWSDLSTILETRSNASSPATTALLTAANVALGTSAASRRSACSAATAPLQRRQSPGARLDQLAHMRRASSVAAASVGGSPRSAVAGFAVPSAPPSSRCGPPSAPPSARSGGGPVGEPSPAGSGSVLGVGDWEAGSAGGASAASQGQQLRGQPQKAKVVSLLAKGLKSVGQKQTWANLLPTVNTVRRVGPNGVPSTQRTWSWRSNGSDSAENSRRGGDSSSRRGRRQQAAALAALQAEQQRLFGQPL